MICVLSFIVFGVLGIFSAKYRELSLEAFDCIKTSLRREPCETNLDDRIQATVVGKALSYSPRLGSFLNNYFQLISWLVLIALIISGFLAAEGIYNYLMFGNCNGAQATTGCTINQTSNFIDLTYFWDYCHSVLNNTAELAGEIQ